MPAGPKGERRPADVIGNAVRVMRTATAEESDAQVDDGKNKAAQETGHKGSAARSASKTRERRAEGCYESRTLPADAMASARHGLSAILLPGWRTAFNSRQTATKLIYTLSRARSAAMLTMRCSTRFTGRRQMPPKAATALPNASGRARTRSKATLTCACKHVLCEAGEPDNTDAQSPLHPTDECALQEI